MDGGGGSAKPTLVVGARRGQCEVAAEWDLGNASCDHGFFHKNTSNDFQNSHYVHFPLSTAELVWTLGQTNNALEKFAKLVKQTRILILWRPFAACAHSITSHHHRVWALFFASAATNLWIPACGLLLLLLVPLSIKRRRRRKRGLLICPAQHAANELSRKYRRRRKWGSIQRLRLRKANGLGAY